MKKILPKTFVKTKTVSGFIVDIRWEIKNITRQIVERYKPEKIWLFGSAAQGNFSLDTDLDFLIIKKDTPESGLERIRQLRYLIDKKVAADFLVCRPEEIDERIRLGDPFIKSIFQEGKQLYG